MSQRSVDLYRPSDHNNQAPKVFELLALARRGLCATPIGIIIIPPCCYLRNTCRWRWDGGTSAAGNELYSVSSSSVPCLPYRPLGPQRSLNYIHHISLRPSNMLHHSIRFSDFPHSVCSANRSADRRISFTVTYQYIVHEKSLSGSSKCRR